MARLVRDINHAIHVFLPLPVIAGVGGHPDDPREAQPTDSRHLEG